MKIEVLGPGCPNCEKLVSIVKKALDELGLKEEVIKITELPEILARGVLTTPALSINDKIVVSGRIPSVEEIKKIIPK